MIFLFLLFLLINAEIINPLEDLSRYNANKMWIFGDLCYAIKFSETYPDFYGIDLYNNYELKQQCKTLIIDGFQNIEIKAGSLESVEKVIIIEGMYIKSCSFGYDNVKEY